MTLSGGSAAFCPRAPSGETAGSGGRPGGWRPSVRPAPEPREGEVVPSPAALRRGARGLTPALPTATPRRPPAVRPRAEAQALGLKSPRAADPSGPSEPLPHPGPGARSPHRSLESGRPGLCKQLFKGFLQFSALGGCLFQAHLPTLKIYK